jgi:hypothetical protein
MVAAKLYLLISNDLAAKRITCILKLKSLNTQKNEKKFTPYGIMLYFYPRKRTEI